jgi:hypothetical protein
LAICENNKITFILWKIFRLPTMASMMAPRPSALSTMSEAARAASVAPATAIPMSARLSAGASFTPSPVIPGTNYLNPVREFSLAEKNKISKLVVLFMVHESTIRFRYKKS